MIRQKLLGSADGSGRTVRIIGYGALFFFSFSFFLFVTFPYEVVKETIAGQLSQATGYSIQMGDLSASIPLGLKAEQIQIEAPSGATLRIASAKVKIAVLKILMGKVSPSLHLRAGNGEFEVDLDFSLLDLARQVVMPRHLSFQARKFPLDDLIDFGLGVAAGGADANPMVAPLLQVIKATATLQAKGEFDLNLKTPTDSTGFADINLTNAVLKLDHPTLGLPNQQFSKALIKAKVEGGSVVIDSSSGLTAEELEFLVNGKVSLRPDPMASMLDLNMEVKLIAGLKDKFGFLIDAVTGSATSEGKLSMQVRGPLKQPTVSMF